MNVVFERVNPAGQQLRHRPAQPTQPFLQGYPQAVNTGVFIFYRDAFLEGQPNFYGVDYRFDGLYAYYQFAAQHADDLLVLTFTDSPDVPQGDLVTAGQRRQAEQQGELQRVSEQAPVAIFVFHGPTYVIQVVNPAMSELVGLPGSSPVCC